MTIPRPIESQLRRCLCCVFSCLVASALVSSEVRAHTLEGPETVQADESGAFSYTVTLIAGPGPVTLASGSIFPGENIAGGGEIADFFCNVVLEEGEELSVEISGFLFDPELPGSMTFEFSFCGDPSLVLETVIQPAGTDVPAVSFRGLLTLTVILGVGALWLRVR